MQHPGLQGGWGCEAPTGGASGRSPAGDGKGRKMPQKRSGEQGLWQPCEGGKGHGPDVTAAERKASGCTKSGKASQAHAVGGKVLCAAAAKAAKVKRTNAMADSDRVSDRQRKTAGEVKASIQAGAWKGHFTKGGALKGGTPHLTSDEAAALLKGLRAAAKTVQPKAKAPAKARVPRPKRKAV